MAKKHQMLTIAMDGNNLSRIRATKKAGPQARLLPDAFLLIG